MNVFALLSHTRDQVNNTAGCSMLILKPDLCLFIWSTTADKDVVFNSMKYVYHPNLSKLAFNPCKPITSRTARSFTANFNGKRIEPMLS